MTAPPITRLSSRVALVTGGASGIGAATARRLAMEGARVVVADIQDEKGDQVVRRLAAEGYDASYVHLDVASPEEWDRAVERTVAIHGGLGILVNNAGISDVVSIDESTWAEYQRVVSVTQHSVYLGMRAASAELKRSGHGSVVNVSSMFGIVGGFGVAVAYAASKGAIRTLTKTVALDWAQQGVRVNSVHPGIISTPILGKLPDPEIYDRKIPMRRIGSPEEVAGVIAFLSSDDASYVTGTELLVDGGYVAR